MTTRACKASDEAAAVPTARRDLDSERAGLNALAASSGEHYCSICERRLSLAEFSATDPETCQLCQHLMTAPPTARQGRFEAKAKKPQHRQRLRFTLAERRAAFRLGCRCPRCQHPIGLNNAYWTMRGGTLYMRGTCAPCYLASLAHAAREYRQREPGAGAAASRRWLAKHRDEYNAQRNRRNQAEANRNRTPQRRENVQLARTGLRCCEGQCHEVQPLDTAHFQRLRPGNYLYECRKCWRVKKADYMRQKRAARVLERTGTP